jgi:hypothetical protein
MKKLISKISLLGMLLVASTSIAAGAKEYSAKLGGSEVVPPVDTKASGEAMFTPEGKGLKYRVTTQGLENVTGMHVHLGKKGENGPPVGMILKGAKKGPLPLTEGTISKKDLAGKLKGKDVKALVAEMEKGNAYLNIHTEKHPNGEIRGQIQ